MATYTISTAVTVAGDAQKINTGDTVTVTSSGSLNGTGAAGVGIYSANTGGAHGGFDTLNISGTVRGGEYGFEDTGTSGNDTVTVNAGGTIFGGYDVGPGAAIYLDAGTNTIANAGNIVDNLGGCGIELEAGGNSITNTGTISVGDNDAIYVHGGSNTINNSGLIATTGDYAVDINGGHNMVTNSGSVTGYYGIYVSDSGNSITNSGTISTSYTGIVTDGNSNAVNNSGTISILSDDSAVELDGSHNSLTNSGAITGGTDIAVGFYGTHDSVVNKASGTISGAKYGLYTTNAKSASIVNSGVIKGGDEGLYSDGGLLNSHVKVLSGASIIGTADTGIYAYGNTLTGSQNTFVVKGLVQGGDYGMGLYYSGNTVRVGAHGSVVGVADSGIYIGTDHSARIFNAGTIKGEGAYGIDLYDHDSGTHIHNTGSIIGGGDSGIYSVGGSNHVTNQGTISGVYCAVDLRAGSNSVTNLASGTMKAAVTAASTEDATVYLKGGSNTVTNSGKMVMALHGATDDAVIFASAGTNTITNNAGGLISDYHGGQTSNFAVRLGDGSNVVTNSGKIVGTVQIGTGGTNSYAGADGRLKGTVVGGDGNDVITLGKGHSSVIGHTGADSITIGSGADNLVYTKAFDSYTDVAGDANYDSVDGFAAGTDHFTFALGGHAFNGLDSVTVSSLAAVNTTTIDAAIAGHLDPYGAVALSVSSGLYSGDVFLVVDADGNSTFSSGDYLVVLTHLSGTLSASDITTT